MAFRIVGFVQGRNRNVPQDSSRYHNGAESGRAEGGSKCCWLSQRGSNWQSAQPTQILNA